MHLVLDLDETLVSVSLSEHPDAFKFTLEKATYYGRKRPHLDLFLTYVFNRFETVNIWTAATADYARHVIKNIMTPDQIRRLKFIRTREDLGSKIHLKPLKVIFNSPEAIKLGITPSNTIMIDDRTDVLRDNPGNGIVIPPWKGDKQDLYLPSLIIVLDGILHFNLGFGQGDKVIDLRSIVDEDAVARQHRRLG